VTRAFTTVASRGAATPPARRTAHPPPAVTAAARRQRWHEAACSGVCRAAGDHPPRFIRVVEHGGSSVCASGHRWGGGAPAPHPGGGERGSHARVGAVEEKGTCGGRGRGARKEEDNGVAATMAER